MPLSSKGKKTLAAMQKTYGADKGKRVFYASVNAGKVSEAVRRFNENMAKRHGKQG